MKLSATEKRIYALAQKWAKENVGRAKDGLYYSPVGWGKNVQRRACGRALLKLFKERD